MAKYDIGQRVKYPCPSVAEGEITGISIGKDRRAHYQIGTSTYNEEDISPIEEATPDSKHTYKAGDKVKVIGNTCGHQSKIGSIIALEKMRDRHANPLNCPAWGIVGSPCYISERDIEPYTETKEDTFDWDAFQAGKVAVECKTEESKNLFLRDCEKHLPDLRWHSGDKPTSRDYPAPLVFQCKDGTMGKGAYGGVQPIDYAIPETAPTFTVTREQIASLGACSSGLAWFDKRHADGKADFGKLVKDAEEDGRSGDAAWLRNREAKLKETPKFFSGKVVCTGKRVDFLTVGKTYTFENGLAEDDFGDPLPFSRSRIDSVDQIKHLGTFAKDRREARHE